MVSLSDFILEGELEAERNSVRRERETEEESFIRRQNITESVGRWRQEKWKYGKF